MKRIILTGLLASLAAGVASAQPVLEELEKKIRERVNPSAAPPALGNPAAATNPAPSAGQPAGVVPQPLPESGYLGVVGDDSKDRGRGVRVLEVRAGSPAEKGGIRVNDLINGLAGIRVREMTDMSDILVLFSPGDTLTFDVARDGRQQQAKVTLGRQPGGQGALKAAATLPAAHVPPPLPVSPPSPARPIAGPQPAPPAVAPPAGPELSRLQQRVEELERRVAELEKSLLERRK
jgi:hypothetical protein